jgi:hypothetical protein
MSILNGQDVFRAFLYAIKTSAMIGILFISLPNIRYLKTSYHHSILTFSILFILVTGLIFGTDNTGIYQIARVSGIFFDPNFVCFTLISLLFLGIVRNNILYKITIIATQSISMIGSTLLALLLFKTFRKYGIQISIILYVLVSASLMYIAYSISVELTEQLGYIAQRFNSLILRVIYISMALSALQEAGVMAQLFGFGSGRSYEISDSVLHSFSAQGLFDYGIIGFIFILFVTFCACRDVVEKKYWVICSFASFSIDVFSSGLFVFFLIWKRVMK